MMGRIVVNIDSLQKAAEGVYNAKEEFKEKFADADEKIELLVTNDWVGEDAGNFATQWKLVISNKKSDYCKCVAEMENYYNFLQKAISEYTSAQREAATNAVQLR